MGYHKSVLLNECVEGLRIKPNGIYVDVTFGGGGHSQLLLSKLDGGKLFAFDQDESASINTINQPSFKLIQANFRYIKNFLRSEGITKIDGLIADLGVSSHQFDIPQRGFSIRFDGPLDMRMNPKADLSAREVVNNYSEEALAKVLYEYGELRNSRKIAREIIVAREKYSINTTAELIAIVGHIISGKYKRQFLARVFQAIRIEVNDEITALKEMLLSAVELLRPQGRLVVLSYHSLEDRVVKNLIKKGNVEGKLKKDFFGNPVRKLKEINSKVVVPSESEIKNNPRSKSAKLRIAEKIDGH